MPGTRVVEPSEIATGSKRSLLLSIVATFSVAVAPTFIAFALLVFSQPEPRIVGAIGLSIALTAGAVVVGSALWARQPEAAGVAFGDLMLWSWIRHYQAERTLVYATATLGFDRYGRFLGYSTASADEQLHAMRSIAKALDAKSSYTLGHSRRVEKHARNVAEAMGLAEEKTNALSLAALLHDVGNVALSDDVLRKAGRLTIEERAEIEAHVLVGAQMVEKAGSVEVIEGIRHHHEQWDGSGYPDHLRGHQIPGFARIIAIAEAYDAMTSTRPYRQGFSTSHAIDVLRAESGSQFDGELVEVFVSTLPRPSALAERFPFIAAIQRNLRELGLVFRRIGAVAISATASTIAIALILGSTMLSPGTPDDVPDIADRRGAEPIDRVLDERIASTDDDDVVGTGDDAGSVSDPRAPGDDRVLGLRITDTPEDRSGDLTGDVTLPGGDPDPNPDPDPGPGPDPSPGPGNGGGGPGGGGGGPVTTPPGGGGGPGRTPTPTTPPVTPPVDDKDKNPDAPGSGHAHGRDPEGPGKSENAPGQSDNSGGSASPGNSGNAPGHSDDGGGSAPGNSGNAPGHNKDSGGGSSNSAAPAEHHDAPAAQPESGNSGDAPGRNK